MKHKFKVGDKVRILPSAVNGGIAEKAVGKIGKIIKYRLHGDYFLVVMCNSKDGEPNPLLPWAVYSDQMTPIAKVGQQLLFSFMEESE